MSSPHDMPCDQGPKTNFQILTRGGALAGGVEEAAQGGEQAHHGRVRQRVVGVEAQARQQPRALAVAEWLPQLVQRRHTCRLMKNLVFLLTSPPTFLT